MNISSIKEEQKKVADCTIGDKCGDVAGVPKVHLSTKRSLKGHINKVNSVHYSEDSRWFVVHKLVIFVWKNRNKSFFVADIVFLVHSMENL